MAQPLTDAINALTRYANETTGASDPDLSSAVRTLCDGYGGGSSETLPTEYQRVEYIAPTNCYIYLGTFSYENVGFIAEFKVTYRGNTYGPHFLSSDNTYLRFVPREKGNTLFQLYGGAETTFPPYLPLDTPATGCLFGTLGALGWASNGGSLIIPKGTVSSGQMYLFTYAGKPGDNWFNFVGEFYSLRIFDGNVMVHNYVPCYRKADGVIGIYDTVGKEFLTKTGGSGTFAKGADVN